MEKSLVITLNDIPDDLRLILRKGTQTRIIMKAIKKCKSIKRLAKRLKVDRSTIYCWRKEWCFMKLKNLKELLKINDMSLDEIRDKIEGIKSEGKIKVLFRQKLPFELPIELIAHLQGDGSVKKRDGRCNYTNQEPFLVWSFVKIFNKCFSTKVNVYREKNCMKVDLPAVIGKILVQKFGKFTCKEFVVPELKKKETIRRYLRAIFDDEGSVVENKKKHYRYISLRLVNRSALRRIRDFLRILGINPHIYEYKFELRISGFNDILQFAREINFTHPLQKKKLKNIVDHYKRIAR